MRMIINIHLPGFIKPEQMILDFLHIGWSNFICDRSSCLATKSYAGKTDHGEKRPDGGFQDRKFFWIERGTPTGAKNFS